MKNNNLKIEEIENEINSYEEQMRSEVKENALEVTERGIVKILDDKLANHVSWIYSNTLDLYKKSEAKISEDANLFGGQLFKEKVQRRKEELQTRIDELKIKLNNMKTNFRQVVKESRVTWWGLIFTVLFLLLLGSGEVIINTQSLQLFRFPVWKSFLLALAFVVVSMVYSKTVAYTANLMKNSIWKRMVYIFSGILIFAFFFWLADLRDSYFDQVLSPTEGSQRILNIKTKEFFIITNTLFFWTIWFVIDRMWPSTEKLKAFFTLSKIENEIKVLENKIESLKEEQKQLEKERDLNLEARVELDEYSRKLKGRLQSINNKLIHVWMEEVKLCIGAVPSCFSDNLPLL